MGIKVNINKILFELYLFCAILGGIIRNIFGIWENRFGTYSFVSKGPWGTLFIMLSLMILFILMFRCNVKYQEILPQKLRILSNIMIIYYGIWTFISLTNNSIENVFLGGVSTSIIILPLAFVLGYDLKIWMALKKFLPLLCIILIFAFYYAVLSFWKQYGIQTPMNASYKGIFSYLITTVWLTVFIYINNKEKRRFIYGILFFTVMGAFIVQSRAWILQTLMLLFSIFLLSGRKNRFFKIILGILFGIIIVIVISYIFPSITEKLINRGFEDTRSGQYAVFFSQYSWKSLIVGAGLNATYKYLGNDFYPYFDNQFMFMMFHYGVLPVIYWLTVYFFLFKKKKIRDDITVASKFVGSFVLLAYLGVSTYYQIELGYSSVLIMILFGNSIARNDIRLRIKKRRK